MKCDCCGIRKKLFESFEKVEPKINLCVECSTLHYKLRDSKAEEDAQNYKQLLSEIEKRSTNKASKEYEKWFKSFK